MIIWSVRDRTGHRHVHGMVTDIATAWRRAGEATVEVAERMPTIEMLIVEVDAHEARVYPGDGIAGPGPMTLRDVIAELVRATSPPAG